MKTTTLPPKYLRPARPVVPRPLWQRDQLFLEPDLPEQPALDDDDEDDRAP